MQPVLHTRLMTEWKNKTVVLLDVVREAFDRSTPNRGDQKMAATAALLGYLAASEATKLVLQQQVLALSRGHVSEWMGGVLGLDSVTAALRPLVDEALIDSIIRSSPLADQIEGIRVRLREPRERQREAKPTKKKRRR